MSLCLLALQSGPWIPPEGSRICQNLSDLSWWSLGDPGIFETPAGMISAQRAVMLSGGEAKAPPLSGPHCPPERLWVQMLAAWRWFHGGLRCGLPATLIHSRHKNKNKQTKKIKQATHVIPGTPARLMLCFSIISLSSSSGEGASFGILHMKCQNHQWGEHLIRSSALPKSSQEEASLFLFQALDTANSSNYCICHGM